MKFLSPEFLFGLFALAIPVLIHLFNFRKFKKVYFTNVRFLKDIQEQTSSTQKLKNLLILATRLLALFFLVMAFAQPYFGKVDSKGNINNVSIYIDNSFSMEATNKEGSLLDEAKRRAKEITDSYGINDRFQLLTNNFKGEQQRLLSKAEFGEALNGITIFPLGRDYQTILNRQSNLLLQQSNTNKAIYLLSDFQQQTTEPKIDNKEAIAINLVPIKAQQQSNVSVDSAFFMSPVHQPNTEEKLVVRLTNHSEKAAENIPIKLNINEQQKAIGNINVPARKSVLDTLNFSGLSAGWQKMILTIKDYPIVFDDTLSLSFEVKAKANILNIHNKQPNKYIKAAYQTDAFFAVKYASESEIDYGSLQNNQLVILSNLPSVADGLAQQLKQYVESGGTLAVFIPLKADLLSYQKLLKSVSTDYPIGINSQSLNANKLNIRHPFFDNVFDQLPKNLDLPQNKQILEMSNLSRTTRQTLIYGEAGTNLLSVYKVKKGKVYICAMPLEPEFSNFTSHTLFLPVFFKMALSGFGTQRLFETIGSNNAVLIANKGLTGDNIIKISNGKVEIIPEVRPVEAGSKLFFADQIQVPGFYDIKNGNFLLALTSFNFNRSESDMRYYDENALKEIFKEANPQIINSNSASVNPPIKESLLGTSLWKVCLILSLIFLLIEILLIRFYNRLGLKQTTV